MSIIKELYEIFDKERARYTETRSSRSRVVGEISRNLAFVREGLRDNLEPAKIIAQLEDADYIEARKRGVNLGAVQSKKLSKQTYGSIREFGKYEGWDTDRLVQNAYERIDTLKKLNLAGKSVNASSRLKYLFKYLLLVMAHIKRERIG